MLHTSCTSQLLIHGTLNHPSSMCLGKGKKRKPAMPPRSSFHRAFSVRPSVRRSRIPSGTAGVKGTNTSSPASRIFRERKGLDVSVLPPAWESGRWFDKVASLVRCSRGTCDLDLVVDR